MRGDDQETSENRKEPKMLSEKMIASLNHQIGLEMYSSHLYLQASSWAVYNSLDGCATFLNKHADEELQHGRRLLNYLHETGSRVILKGVQSPPESFESLSDMFNTIYAHERMVTEKINELVHLATTEPDYSTLHFLQWYVAEQHEEEFLFKSVLDKITLIGTGGQGLFFIDREIGTLTSKRQ